jgi:colanic acid biosynthesis glycosyl transferase WcaI
LATSPNYDRGSHDDALRDKQVLIVGVNYWPETTGIGPYTTGFAEHLAAAGARVTVVTAVPHYPAWRIQAEYADGSRSRENRAGVEIHRVVPRVPSRMTARSRAMFEASFAWLARSTTRRMSRADAVLGIVPSLGGAAVAASVASAWRAPCGVIFQDLMGNSAQQSGMAGRGVARLTTAIETAVARRASLVGVVASGFSSFLASVGVDQTRVRLLPNWCHISAPTRARAETRRELGWSNDEIIALHAGNMGAKQALENVVEAARIADRLNKRIRFVLMGQGSRREAIEEQARGVRSITFREPAPAGLFPDILAAADVLLVNERASVRDMSLPSKLTSYFAAGRPVVAAARDDGTTASELRRSAGGLLVSPEQPQALLDAIEEASRLETSAELGSAGKRYADQWLSEPAAATRSVQFASELIALAN